jgi:hypothetical protein
VRTIAEFGPIQYTDEKGRGYRRDSENTFFYKRDHNITKNNNTIGTSINEVVLPPGQGDVIDLIPVSDKYKPLTIVITGGKIVKNLSRGLLVVTVN